MNRLLFLLFFLLPGLLHAQGAAPVPTAPADGATMTSPVTFQWEPPPGSDNLYRLQIATTPDFSPLLVNRGGITTTERSETLLNGTYYWRVRAAFSGQAGPWSEVGTFTVGEAPSPDPDPEPDPEPEPPIPTPDNVPLICTMAADHDLGIAELGWVPVTDVRDVSMSFSTPGWYHRDHSEDRLRPYYSLDSEGRLQVDGFECTVGGVLYWQLGDPRYDSGLWHRMTAEVQAAIDQHREDLEAYFGLQILRERVQEEEE